MTCPCFSLPHSLSLSPPPPLWGVGRSVGFRPGGFFSGGCPVCCCCSLRDPLRGAGVQTGVGSLALEEEGRQLVWCSRGHHSTGGRGARLSFRPGCAGVCACVWDRAGAAKGLAGAGRRAGRGPGCAVRGVPSEKGGAVRRGRSGSGEKRPYPLSLSLRFVFSTLFCRRCALHLAPGAICASAVVGSTLADSDSVSYTPSPAPVGCSADPASLTAAPKGPLLGGLPIVSGLEGVW